MTDLLGLLPEYYKGIKDFVELMETENAELDQLLAAVQRQFDDQFVETAGEQAIKRREQQLGIRADVASETLEFRRKRIVNRYSTKPPFTIRYLQERLDFLVGEGRALAEIDEQSFVLTITMSVPDAAYFREIEHTIKQMKPANIVYNQATALADTIMLEERAWSIPLIRQTRLSTSWRVGITPLSVRGQEVRIV